jgi:alkylation response protein AidB-like acyl-CoA dehydrogenase
MFAEATAAIPERPVNTVDDAEPLPGLRTLIAESLAPQVLDIDLKGQYPENFMRRLGTLGGYSALMPAPGRPGTDIGLGLAVMEAVGRECVSTSFLVWAQYACLAYVALGNSPELRAEILSDLAAGRVLGGTAQSNSMKSCVGIEETRLKATEVQGGYLINGVLPWVSNIGVGHYFHFGAALDGYKGLLIGFTSGNAVGLALRQNAHFVALEGTNTYACQFKDVFLPTHRVICHPQDFERFRSHTKPIFVLMQTGMGLGLIDACVGMMRRANQTLAHVNVYLDDQPDELAADLHALRSEIYALAGSMDADPVPCLEQALHLRLRTSELSLRAAQSAMLHLGAKGYLIQNAAQRRLREAYFIAIVTPAIKQLRKELHDLRAGGAACALS